MSDAPPRRCPICDKPAPAREVNRFLPFCSARCKDIDLARWFDGAYVISRPLFGEAPPLEATDDEDPS